MLGQNALTLANRAFKKTSWHCSDFQKNASYGLADLNDFF